MNGEKIFLSKSKHVQKIMLIQLFINSISGMKTPENISANVFTQSPKMDTFGTTKTSFASLTNLE